MNTLLDSNDALRPVLDLAQESADANISTIRTVVLKALSDPKIFAGFDEIKHVIQPRLASLGTPEGEPILRTLDLFSYGTYSDYGKAAPNHFLSLSDSQVFKLRQLTLVSLVQKAACTTTTKGGCKVPYQAMARELGFLANGGDISTSLDDSVLRQAEEVALACVYSRILAGQLCQKSAALFVSSRNGPPCRPRDVPLSEGSAMLDMLRHFHESKLMEAQSAQDRIQQTVQMQLDSTRNYHQGVSDRIKKAETTSIGSASNPALICGGGSVRGWAEGATDERRLSELGGSARGSTSSRRQTKRSRGGAMDALGRY